MKSPYSKFIKVMLTSERSEESGPENPRDTTTSATSFTPSATSAGPRPISGGIDEANVRHGWAAWMKEKEETGLVLRPSYWASVSGGKDSLFMLNLILHNLDRYPLNGVVHYELEIDYPFIHDVIDHMENECKRVGIPFFRLKPRRTWKELYDKYGFPTRKARWCNDKYKLDCLKQLDEFLHSKGCYTVSYIGYCADEQKRADTQIQKKSKNVYPLIENGIMEDTILEWAKTHPIFNDFYKFNRRCGCMLCPMQSLSDQAYLAKYYPLLYEEMNRLAYETEIKRESELGRPFSVWSSNPKYNTQYRDNRVRQKYLPELEDKIREDIRARAICSK